MQNAVQISENEAIGRLTHIWGMFKNGDPAMGAALKMAIDTMSKPKTFLHELGDNDKARRRLEEILDHNTEICNDGQSLVIGVDNAAEVYTILFQAFTDPEGALAELVAPATDEKTILVGEVEPMQNVSLPDEEPEYETVPVPVDVLLTSLK